MIVGAVSKHVTKSFIAGIVALLPIGGLVLSVVFMETTIAGSWLARQAFYFPGMGMIAAAVIIYLIGLIVTTFLGRWMWRRIDRLLDTLPMLGRLYQTLKQILGYGEGKDAIFQGVVLMPSREFNVMELGLVTNTVKRDNEPDRLVVFLPGAPTPTAGRLVVVPADEVVAVNMTVNDALKALVSVGKVDLAAGLTVPVPPAPIEQYIKPAGGPTRPPESPL